MGLETRGGRSYYYRKRRIGDRVVSEYVGAGETARLIAVLEDLERDREDLRRHDEKAETDHVDAMIAAQQRYGDLTAELATVAFLLAGYHMHHGQWRKERDRN